MTPPSAAQWQAASKCAKKGTLSVETKFVLPD